MDAQAHAVITEIDISQPARALWWLRLADYALVILCGLWALGLAKALLFEPASDGVLMVGFEWLSLAVLGWATYTGWRHVGVIDPGVWRAYRQVFPLLIVLTLFVSVSTLLSLASLEAWPDAGSGEHVELVMQLSGLFNSVQVLVVAVAGTVCLRRLRRSHLAEPLSASVDQALMRLKQRAGQPAATTLKLKRINEPMGLLVGGAGVLILLGLHLLPLPEGPKWAEVQLKLGSQMSMLGFFLLVRARRYFQVDADALMAMDKRAPILFLRSFDDDEKQQYGASDKALLDFSLETRLANHFSRFGPFVAIGSPKESLPQLGAARVLLSDEAWQPRVLGWMRAASLIIMYSGKTHWVNWELRQLLENGCATRLILMVPEVKGFFRSRRRQDVQARIEQVRAVFEHTPWASELAHIDDLEGLRAMLFRQDGSMVMIKSRSRGRDSYHLAAVLAHEVLLASSAMTLPHRPEAALQAQA